MTTESFLVACKRSKLTFEDLEVMTVGMCMDYAIEFAGLEENNGSKGAIIKASQKEFDSF